MSTRPFLDCAHVQVRYGEVRAVQDATLSAPVGAITALIGPNGAGKTSMFNAITGFVRPSAGEVRVDGVARNGATPQRLARDGLVRTFQLSKTLTNMTVLDNMRVAARDQLGEFPLAALVRWPAVRAREREVTAEAMSLLERFRLADLAGELAGNLSGGQSKLLEIARSLMLHPRMLLLDEPLAGVNPSLGEEILQHIVSLKEAGMGFVLVEHDMQAVMRVSDIVVVMADGKDIAVGPPAEIQQSQAVIDAYLGKVEDAS